MVIGNANGDELVWLGCAVVGLIASIYDLTKAHNELRRHWNDREGPILGIAISGLAKSILLFLVTILGLMIGLAAAVTPQPVSQPAITYTSVIAHALILMHLFIVIVVLIKGWEHQYVEQYIWKAEPKGKEGPCLPK